MDAAYGFRFEEVNTVVRPAGLPTAWGEWMACSVRPEYSLFGLRIDRGGVQPMHFYLHCQGAYYVEEGRVLLSERLPSGETLAVCLTRGEVAQLTRGMVHGVAGLEPSVVYLLTDGGAEDARYVETVEDAHARFNASRLGAGPRTCRQGTVDHRVKY